MTGRPAVLRDSSSGVGTLADRSKLLIPCAGLALLLGNVVLGYPGEMMPDAAVAYHEALTGRYTEVHPPIMARLWSWLMVFGYGPAPLFILHLFLFWGGLTLIADGLARSGRSRSAFAVLALGLLPPFAFLNLAIWKDVSMVVAWLTAFGLVFWFQVQGRAPWPLAVMASVALCIYGLLTRHNAVFGFAPLLLYALLPPGRLGVRTLIAGTMALAVVALPLSHLINTRLLGARTDDAQYNTIALSLYDLTGIARHTGKASILSPDGSISLDEIEHCYTAYGYETMATEDKYMRAGVCSFMWERFRAYLNASGSDPVRMWLDAILAEPLAYLSHRLKHFNSAMFFLSPAERIRFRPDKRPEGYPPDSAADISLAERAKDLFVHSPLWSPANWAMLGAVLLAATARLPSLRSVHVLLVSALGYAMAYLVVGLTTTKRHNYWTLIAIMIAAIVCAPLIADRLRARDRWTIAGVVVVAAFAAAGLYAQLFDVTRFVH